MSDEDALYKMKREMLRRGLTHKTLVTYCQCIKQFIRAYPKDWRRVRKSDIQEYLDRMVDRGKASSTINVHLNAIKFLFEQVLRRRITFKIQFSKKPKRLPVCLTRNEVIRLIDAVRNPTHRLIVELMYSAGLRVGEVVKLRKEDLELDRNIGWVRQGKGRKDRPFIIAEVIKERLEEYTNVASGQYLFPGRRDHLTIRSVQEIIKTATKRAGIRKRIHPHSLRHSFATHLIENGYDIPAVQPLMGHCRPDTTMIYLHTALPRIAVKSPYDALRKDIGQ